MSDHAMPDGAVMASAPTRVCLGGEDLDWLGGTLLLAAIELRVFVKYQQRPKADTLVITCEGARPARVSLRSPSWHNPTSSDLELVRLCWQYAMARSTPTPGGIIEVSSDAPPGAGLATSATTCVGALQAFAISRDGHQYVDDAHLARAAYAVERWYAGRSIGPMDLVPAVSGGVTVIEGGSEAVNVVSRHTLPPATRLVVVDTRTPRDARAIVGWKRRRALEGDEGIHTYAARTAELVTQQAHLMATSPDLEALGATLDAAQTLLADYMEVSTPLIDACVARLKAHGALGAKLTGAGLGGCVVALTTSDNAEHLVACLTDLPVTARVVRPAAEGVVPPLEHALGAASPG